MNYNRNNIAPQAFLRLVTVIYAALLCGQAMFAAVAYYMTNSIGLNLKPSNDIYFYVAPVFILGGIGIGTFAYRKLLAKLPASATLKEKIAGYQSAFIFRAAISEGATLFCIVCYVFTGNLFYLILAGANVLYFLSFVPTKRRIEEDANLSYEDKVELLW